MSYFKTLSTIIFVATLASCSERPDLNGTFNTSRKTFLGSESLSLRVNGSTANIDFLGKSMQLKTKIEDERLIIYQNTPADGIIFYIREKGKLLECVQCEQKEFGGKFWEKVH